MADPRVVQSRQDQDGDIARELPQVADQVEAVETCRLAARDHEARLIARAPHQSLAGIGKSDSPARAHGRERVLKQLQADRVLVDQDDGGQGGKHRLRTPWASPERRSRQSRRGTGGSGVRQPGRRHGAEASRAGPFGSSRHSGSPLSHE